MKEADARAIQNELSVQKAIDDCVGELVGIAETLIVQAKEKLKENRVDKSQLRNVLAVANAAPHVAVVTNFIRYQMGRGGNPSKAWRDTGLGQAVINEIDGKIRTLAQQAAQQAETTQVDDVQVQMTRLLLGFMNRRFVFERKDEER